MTRPASTAPAFVTITALFLGWGLTTSLIDPLVAAVKGIFSLSNVEAQLSAFAFFIAYGLVSVPAALLVQRLRPVPAILVALGLMIGGCLTILVASNLAAYPLVLAGLFVLASGVTILQVAANPLAAALGRPERSHFRLTLAQAFNSLGTVLGPLLGAALFLRHIDALKGAGMDETARRAALGAVDTAFLIVMGFLALLALAMWSMRRRITAAAPPAGPRASVAETLGGAFGARWALLGAGAIFLYVGAEVSIGTQLALYLNDPGVWNVTLQQAGYYVSLYWLGAMVGRFAGSALMIAVPAARLLAIATASAVLLCAVVLTAGGAMGGYAALAVGLFNSIMFPTIFTLTLERSTASAAATSGLLCTAIVGGAFLPLLAGVISDAAGYERSFIVPLTCYALLCGFAVVANRTAPHRAVAGGDSPH